MVSGKEVTAGREEGAPVAHSAAGRLLLTVTQKAFPRSWAENLGCSYREETLNVRGGCANLRWCLGPRT